MFFLSIKFELYLNNIFIFVFLWKLIYIKIDFGFLIKGIVIDVGLSIDFIKLILYEKNFVFWFMLEMIKYDIIYI